MIDLMSRLSLFTPNENIPMTMDGQRHVWLVTYVLPRHDLDRDTATILLVQCQVSTSIRADSLTEAGV